MILRMIFFMLIVQVFSTSSATASRVPVYKNMIFGSYSDGSLSVRLGKASFIDSPWGDKVATYDDWAQITVFRLENGAWVPRGYFCDKGRAPQDSGYTFSKILVNMVEGFEYYGLCQKEMIYGTTGNEYCISWAINGDPVPGQCKAIAPPPVQCNTTTGDILLDHKTINELELKGSKATSNFTVSCNLSAKVKFSLQGGKTSLNIGSGLSTIMINDKPLLSDVDLKSGENKMTISSTLSDVKPGTWQSSAVLIIEPV